MGSTATSTSLRESEAGQKRSLSGDCMRGLAMYAANDISTNMGLRSDTTCRNRWRRTALTPVRPPDANCAAVHGAVEGECEWSRKGLVRVARCAVVSVFLNAQQKRSPALKRRRPRRPLANGTEAHHPLVAT